MNFLEHMRAQARFGLALLTVLLLAGTAISPTFAAENGEDEDLTFEFREQLLHPVRQKVSKLAQEKNAEGVKNRRGVISKNFKKIDDDTYQVSFQQDTAKVDQMVTERMLLTIKRKSGDDWEIAEEELVDTYDRLYRLHGYRAYPYEKFSFNEGGIEMSAGKGALIEWYFNDEVIGFGVYADKLSYEYTPPKYQDYYQLYRFLKNDYTKELLFDPFLFWFDCDPETCEQIIADSFTGLDRPAKEERGPKFFDMSGMPSYVGAAHRNYFAEWHKDRMEARRDNPFAGFNRGTLPGNRWFNAGVGEDKKHQVGLRYDNWGGWEYQFWVYRNAPGASLNGPIFGYYTDETLASNTPYNLEARDDQQSRWYELYKVNGDIEAALEDPEVVKGDVTFGIHVKETTQELPFFIATIQRGENEKYRRPTLFVNSVQYQGEDLTCVRTGAYSYLVVLPEEVPAGTKLELDVDFSSRVIYKVNHAYSGMARGGWLPFVRFGDMIDEFELTVKVPDEYEVLGVGHMVSEERKDGVLTTHWVADNPAEFPTIIFGKYYSDVPRIEAKKLDGTPIPVKVFVDEVSMNQLSIDVTSGSGAREFVDAFSSGARGIRGKQLRAIGEQAVNAINLYQEISGVDYPYGSLNLVNDPAPAMYGQAPSSLIYLGSFVFRGEGTMAGNSILGGGGAGTAKFLKSVVAHEVGHQWWGSRVANANGRNYWFVETLAEYFSALWLEQVHGRDEYMEQVEEWRKRVLEIDMRTSVQNASALWGGELPGAAYQAAVYNKGPMAFHVLRNTFGDEKFFAALKEFCLDLTEKREIVTEEMRVAAEKAFGGVDESGNRYNADLGWFFDQWIRSAGIPQYSFNYATRRAEDGTWIVEGSVKQRVVVGNKAKFHVMDDRYFRGLVSVTVTGKDKQQYPVRFPIDGPETPFAFKVPVEPRDVVLNQNHEMLSLDVLVNRDF